ncbi:hypothetical protein [Rhodanobacter sp. T12-5]|uniref:hypothetical protein n=1 Tax=Rhodanobacter sp. T12-5 TaxID=2024611 RepID=UPI001561DAA8|nr:hypothetical protein [Rhodanobacter sp. T12-5]
MTSAANTVAICNPGPAWSSRDIRALLRAQRGRLNMQEVQGYFALFDRQEMLDELLAEIANDKA